MSNSTSPSKLSDEVRFVFLRASFFSIVVADIFAIFQFDAMRNNSIKASETDVRHGIILISVLPVVLIHHLASAFSIPVDRYASWACWVFIIADVILLSVESCFIIWILRQGYADINPLSDRKSPFLVLAFYALLLCLLALIILRIVDIYQKAKIHKWVMKAILWIFKKKDQKEKQQVKKQKDANALWPHIKGVLSGRRIWEPHYEGERTWMIWCRVALTILFLIIFPFYVTFNVIVQPQESKALMTVKESRSTALPPDFKDVKNARWNVVITSFPDIPFDPPQMAQNALRAITVAKLINNTPTEICTRGTYIKSSTTVPDHISFNCLNATTEEIAQLGRSGITSTTKHFVIAVFANYNQTFNSSVPLMHVRMGLTNDTAAVIRQTRPAILGEHQNMVGECEVFVRRELTGSMLATLGVFRSWKTYLLTDINQYFNDPNATIGRYAGPGISTMIMNMENARYGYRVVEDYLDKTVLDGFSAIGGLFALIGATAALLFGRSILQIMFGLKPLSLFGVVHRWDKDQIKEALKECYPDLVADLGTRKGFMYLMHDRVLEVDVEAAPANPASSNPVPSNPVPLNPAPSNPTPSNPVPSNPAL